MPDDLDLAAMRAAAERLIAANAAMDPPPRLHKKAMEALYERDDARRAEKAGAERDAARAEVAAAVAAERQNFLRLLELHCWLRQRPPSNPEAYDAWVEDNTSAGEEAAKLEAAIRARTGTDALAEVRKQAYREGWNDREADFLAGVERTGLNVVSRETLIEIKAQARREGIEAAAAYMDTVARQSPRWGSPEEHAAAIRALLEDPSHG